MKAITSIGPSRITHQADCIQSWIDVGCSVTAVQSAGETEKLIDYFPSVNFIETDLVGDKFNRPKSVRIKALLNEIAKQDDPMMVINSDIEITTTPDVFIDYWSKLPDNTIKMGVRWDRDRYGHSELLKYGIDVFLLDKHSANALPDIGMTIGCPGWDYWIPWHLNTLNYKILTSKRAEFVHDIHPINWSKQEYSIGIDILTKTYANLTSSMLSSFIQELTDRTSLKPGKMKVQ